MRIIIIVSLCVAALAVLFALQNSQPVAVRFFNWSFEASLVIVLLLTFVAGLLSAFIASIPWRVKMMRELSNCRKAGGQTEAERRLAIEVTRERSLLMYRCYRPFVKLSP